MTRFIASFWLTVAVNALDVASDALTWVANKIDEIEV